MAQYWREITSSADLDDFAIQYGSGSLAYELDGSTPALKFSTTGTSIGQYVRWLDVPSAETMQVRVLARSSNSGYSGNAVGPAARIDGRGAYATTFQTSDAAKRINETTIAGSWLELSAVSSATVTTSVYSWYEIDVVGSGLAARWWPDGGARPSAAGRVATSTTLTAGFAGFGRPRNGNSSLIYVAAISVGTDGDPAPDGPVGGERQRSRLILTPW